MMKKSIIGLFLMIGLIVSSCTLLTTPINETEKNLSEKQQTKDEVNTTLSEKNKVITEYNCNDTDQGINSFVKGIVTEETGSTWTDFCRSNVTLNEFNCATFDGRKHSNLVDCSIYSKSYICKDGACVKSS